jgi:hypothetical protein
MNAGVHAGDQIQLPEQALDLPGSKRGEYECRKARNATCDVAGFSMV